MKWLSCYTIALTCYSCFFPLPPPLLPLSAPSSSAPSTSAASSPTSVSLLLSSLALLCFMSSLLVTMWLLNAGVHLTSSPVLPLRLGDNASLTCNNTRGGTDYIEWRRDDGTLLANASSRDVMKVFFTPVDDSGLTHDRTFTCYVTRNSSHYSQKIRVTIYSKMAFFIYPVCMQFHDVPLLDIHLNNAK